MRSVMTLFLVFFDRFLVLSKCFLVWTVYPRKVRLSIQAKLEKVNLRKAFEPRQEDLPCDVSITPI